jgi:hypothetical protein
MATCITCELRPVQSTGRVHRMEDLVCDDCKTNGEMLWEETHMGTCERCGVCEAYYGPQATYGYLCRSCSGDRTVREAVEEGKYWEAYFSRHYAC